MAKGTIVARFADKVTPIELLQHAANNGKSTFSMTSVMDGKLDLAGEFGTVDVAGIIEAQKQDPSVCVYGFFDYPDDALSEDLQSWETLRDGKGNIICTSFLEGDFSSFKQKDSKHIPAFHAHEKLAKNLARIWRMGKEDFNAFLEELKGKDFQDEIAELFTGDGSIVIHLMNDQVLWFCNPADRKKVYDWGMYAGTPAWEQKTEPKKLTGMDKIAAMMAKKSAKTDDRTPAVTPPAAPKPDTAIPAPDKPIELPPATTKKELYARRDLRNPPTFNRWSKARKWFEDVSPPEQYEYNVQRAKAEFDAGKRLSGIYDRKTVKEVEEEYRLLVAAGKATDLKKEEPNKPAEVVPLKKEEEARVPDVAEMVPMISEKSENYLQEFAKKWLAKDGTVLPRDPAKSQELEENYPNIIEKLGLSGWSELFGVPLEGWQMLTHRHDLARLTMWSMINEIQRCHVALNTATPPVKKEKTSAEIKAEIQAQRQARKVG